MWCVNACGRSVVQPGGGGEAAVAQLSVMRGV